MKTTINIIIATALMAVATSATAKSWRINNNAAAAPDFVSINAAMSSAEVTAGDTLYIDPGSSYADEQTVTKQVTIVGPGYFRTDTPHAFAYFQKTTTLQASNIKVEGLIFNDLLILRGLNITVERCKFTEMEIGRSPYGYEWDSRYATIRQCYGSGKIYGYSEKSNASAYCTIENCILLSGSNCIYRLYLPKIRRNYIKETASSFPFHDLNSATITDNIIINTYETGIRLFNNVSNSVNVSHNVMSGTENASYPDNIYGGTEADIFTLTGMNDQRYQLKDDSPAKGYASDEGDCGPYGGLTPYVAGGLPNGYPYYTKAIIPAKSKDGKVNVSLKIKMQNE